VPLSEEDMDPASAIGVASSAIAFLQFTYQFSTTLFSIVADGTSGPVQYDDLEEVCHKMKHMSLDIELSQEDATAQSPMQMAVLSLSNQCRFLAERILRRLEKIKPANRKLISAIKATVKYIYSKEEFSTLQKNLDTCRGQLHLHLSTLHK
jgi:hypothetical protein